MAEVFDNDLEEYLGEPETDSGDILSESWFDKADEKI